MDEWFDIVKLRAHRGKDTRRGDKIIRTQVWKMLTRMGLENIVSDVNVMRRTKEVVLTTDRNDMGLVIGRRGANLKNIERRLKNWSVKAEPVLR